jgi:leucyl aminopeptidase (aminopeptidase T)
MQIVDMMRGADRLVRELARVTDEDNVLVICDTSTFEIGTAIAAKANEIAKDVVMNVIRVYRGITHGQEPPRAIAEAMKAVNVVFAATEYSISHTKARRDASKLGVRCLTLPAPDTETLARTMVETPFSEMKPVVEKVAELLSNADSAHITTEAGTDLSLNLRGRASVDLEYGYCPPATNFCAPPCVEANIAPVEDTAEGILVVDGTQSAVGLLRDPIKLRIERGSKSATRISTA